MGRLSRVAVLAACLTLASAKAAGAAQPTSPVKVTGGSIVGSAEDSGVHKWLGIPFAAPPVGALRWRAPQPVIPWRGIRATQTFSPACAQTAAWLPNPKSEDCLYLNVWAPTAAKDLPVIVWIHGGGLYGGTGAQPLYDGSNLARRGAVIVTLNYRLGVFGFFAHPELSAESPDGGSGNQGVRDQIAALRWVRDNIAAFGGNPNRVTIAGESAGAESVAILVASPMARGLFQRAIAESGNDAAPLDPSEAGQFDRKGAEAEGAAFMTRAGASRLSDLRAMSVEALQKQPWSPRTIVDGAVLREDLTTTYRAHGQNDVPLLVGWNADEGKDLAPEILGTAEFTAANRRALIAKLLGFAPSDALLAAYPGETDAQAKTSIDQLTNDWWAWRMWSWARLQARYGRSGAYVYLFAHPPAPPATPCGYGCGVGHGVEIQYVFDNLDKDPRRWTEADRRLADRLADTWVAFARGGTPNAAKLPVWPRFDGSPSSISRIGDPADLERYGKLPDFSLFPQPARDPRPGSR